MAIVKKWNKDGQRWKAREKKRKEKVEVVPPQSAALTCAAEFLDVVKASALTYVKVNMNAHVRNQYIGSIDSELQQVTGTGRITIHLKSREEAFADIEQRWVIVESTLDGLRRVDAMETGATLGASVVKQLRERVSIKPIPYEDAYEDEVELIDRLTSKKKKPRKTRKKVCKICGPEDPMYPPWEGVCIHD